MRAVFMLLACAYAAPADRHVSSQPVVPTSVPVLTDKDLNDGSTSAILMSDDGMVNPDMVQLQGSQIEPFESRGHIVESEFTRSTDVLGVQFQDIPTKIPQDKNTIGTQISKDLLGYQSSNAQDQTSSNQDSRLGRKRIVVSASAPCRRHPGVLCHPDVYEFVLYGDGGVRR